MVFIDFIGFIIEYFRAAVPAAIILKCRNAIVTSLSAPQITEPLVNINLRSRGCPEVNGFHQPMEQGAGRNAKNN